jgi:hypothetical protein
MAAARGALTGVASAETAGVGVYSQAFRSSHRALDHRTAADTTSGGAAEG